MIPFGGIQTFGLIGDTTHDNLNAFDASLILQKIVGLKSNFYI